MLTGPSHCLAPFTHELHAPACTWAAKSRVACSPNAKATCAWAVCTCSTSGLLARGLLGASLVGCCSRPPAHLACGKHERCACAAGCASACRRRRLALRPLAQHTARPLRELLRAGQGRVKLLAHALLRWMHEQRRTRAEETRRPDFKRKLKSQYSTNPN